MLNDRMRAARQQSVLCSQSEGKAGPELHSLPAADMQRCKIVMVHRCFTFLRDGVPRMPKMTSSPTVLPSRACCSAWRRNSSWSGNMISAAMRRNAERGNVATRLLMPSSCTLHEKLQQRCQMCASRSGAPVTTLFQLTSLQDENPT